VEDFFALLEPSDGSHKLCFAFSGFRFANRWKRVCLENRQS